MKAFWINRNFFLIWSGQLISQCGDKFYSIALVWWILEKTHSPGIMGLLLAAATLPGLIVGPVAGGIIDRNNRKTIFIWADLVRGMVVGGITFLSLEGVLQVWHVFGAAVFISVASAFYNPAIGAALPQIVPESRLSRANSLSQLVSGLTMVLGPAAGAAVIGLAGFTIVFLLNCLSYLVSGGLAIFIDEPLHPGPPDNREKIGDIRAGFRFVARNKKVLIIMAVIGLAHIAVGSLTVAMPLLARQLKGVGVQNLGLLEMAMGGGMVLGSLLIHGKNEKGPDDRWLFRAMFLMGLAFLMISASRTLGLAFVTPFTLYSALVGLAVVIASVYWNSLLQSHIPNQMAGRVFSIAAMIGNTTLPLAYGFFGFLLGFVTISVVLGICGGLLVIMGLTFAPMFRKLKWTRELLKNSGGASENPS